MVIERMCPSLVTAAHAVIAAYPQANSNGLADPLVLFGDFALGLGALAVVVIGLVASLGFGMFRFVRAQSAYWGKRGD